MGAALAGAGAYYTWIALTIEIGYRQVTESGRDGVELTFPLWVVTAIDGPTRYRISKVVHDVPVEGDTTPLHEGDTVSVIGRFRASDHVVVEEVREIHVLRKVKEALGVLGTVLAIAAAPFGFRLRRGGLVERG